MKGWQYKTTGLWRVPLVNTVENEVTDTLLQDRPDPSFAVNHVYELTSTEKKIQYLHALDFPYRPRGLPFFLCGKNGHFFRFI